MKTGVNKIKYISIDDFKKISIPNFESFRKEGYKHKDNGELILISNLKDAPDTFWDNETAQVDETCQSCQKKLFYLKCNPKYLFCYKCGTIYISVLEEYSYETCTGGINREDVERYTARDVRDIDIKLKSGMLISAAISKWKPPTTDRTIYEPFNFYYNGWDINLLSVLLNYEPEDYKEFYYADHFFEECRYKKPKYYEMIKDAREKFYRLGRGYIIVWDYMSGVEDAKFTKPKIERIVKNALEMKKRHIVDFQKLTYDIRSSLEHQRVYIRAEYFDCKWRTLDELRMIVPDMPLDLFILTMEFNYKKNEDSYDSLRDIRFSRIDRKFNFDSYGYQWSYKTVFSEGLNPFETEIRDAVYEEDSKKIKQYEEYLKLGRINIPYILGENWKEMLRNTETAEVLGIDNILDGNGYLKSIYKNKDTSNKDEDY